jgi:hypothetical protein
LDSDILRQLPEQLKKPLCVVQSENDETDIVSIIRLQDKNGNPIIVPIAQGRRGYVNNAEIDINLVKTVYGKDGFEQWLKAAADEGRLLYVNKKETELILNGQLTRTVQDQFRLATPEPISFSARRIRFLYGKYSTVPGGCQANISRTLYGRQPDPLPAESRC